MTPQEIAPPTPRTPTAPPSASGWALYTYDGLAYLAYAGRLVATASVATPSQEARIEAMFQRLTGQAGWRA